jgi:hypothetical protein
MYTDDTDHRTPESYRLADDLAAARGQLETVEAARVALHATIADIRQRARDCGCACCRELARYLGDRDDG